MMDITARAVQKPAVPITEYVVFCVGLVVIRLPVPPVLQLYIAAPFALSVTLPPGQTLGVLALMDIVGVFRTVTVTVRRSVQVSALAVLLPVTV